MLNTNMSNIVDVPLSVKQTNKQIKVLVCLRYFSFVGAAETDVVLPIVKACPRCLDVADFNGNTARQMLQDFKDRMKQKQLDEVCIEYRVWDSRVWAISNGFGNIYF